MLFPFVFAPTRVSLFIVCPQTPTSRSLHSSPPPSVLPIKKGLLRSSAHSQPNRPPHHRRPPTPHPPHFFCHSPPCTPSCHLHLNLSSLSYQPLPLQNIIPPLPHTSSHFTMAESKPAQKVWLASNDSATIEVGKMLRLPLAHHHHVVSSHVQNPSLTAPSCRPCRS